MFSYLITPFLFTEKHLIFAFCNLFYTARFFFYDWSSAGYFEAKFTCQSLECVEFFVLHHQRRVYCPHTFVRPPLQTRLMKKEVTEFVIGNDSGMCKAGFCGWRCISRVLFEFSKWLKPHPEKICGIAVEDVTLFGALPWGENFQDQ